MGVNGGKILSGKAFGQLHLEFLDEEYRWSFRLRYTTWPYFRTFYVISIILNCTLNMILVHFIYLFGILSQYQYCTDHIPTGSFMGRRNQYIQLVTVLYCKLSTIGKQLPTFPHNIWGLNSVVGGECVTTAPLCPPPPPPPLSPFYPFIIIDIKSVQNSNLV